MADESRAPARSAALFSVLAPALAACIGAFLSTFEVRTRAVELLAGGLAMLFIVAGFVSALVALIGGLRQSRKGVTALAATGLGINGLCLLGIVLLIPALQRVGRMRHAGYTLDQMEAMAQVIPGSRAILNEAIGFRIEIPGDLVENPEPQPEHMLYAFLRIDNNEPTMAVNIERLGGRIGNDPITPEHYEGMRSSLPPGARIEHETMPWKTHRLDVFAIEFPLPEGAACAWSVQVPLAREAIQVNVGGPAASREKYREVLAAILGGVKGISNWDPPSSWTAALPFLPGPRAVTAAPPTHPPAEMPVAPGHSKIRTLPGELPEIPDRNDELIYEFDLSLEPVLIHVPANYDGSEPFGLIVLVPADGPYESLPKGWEPVLAERKLLLVSPQRALNARDSDQRCGLAAVCALKMRQLYEIDPHRIYAAGYSGGARIASQLGYYHAGLFRGTIQSCGSDFHRPVPAVNAVPLDHDNPRHPYGVFSPSAGEIKDARRKVRFVLITGAGDFRYGHLLDIYQGGFVPDEFQAQFIDVPFMTHVTCGPEALTQALEFIESDE